jgi:hypothetical protein
MEKLKRNPDQLDYRIGENKSEGRNVAWAYIIKTAEGFEEWTGNFNSREQAEQWHEKYAKKFKYKFHLVRMERRYNYNIRVFP